MRRHTKLLSSFPTLNIVAFFIESNTIVVGRALLLAHAAIIANRDHKSVWFIEQPKFGIVGSLVATTLQDTTQVEMKLSLPGNGFDFRRDKFLPGELSDR